MTSSPFLGVLLHAVGATSAALCYTPQKGTRCWSWQSFWLALAYGNYLGDSSVPR
jgi:L-rhamnose-H+ transport protein